MNWNFSLFSWPASVRAGFSIVLTCLLAGVVDARESGPQNKTIVPKQVFLITVRGCEEICQSFRKSLEGQGEVHIILRDMGGEVSRLASFVDEARRLKPDLIATWGTEATLAIIGPHDAADRSAFISDIPVVYMYVGDPVASKIATSSARSGRANVAGVNSSVPVEAQVNLLNTYRKLSRIGMIFNGNEKAAVIQAAEARRAFESRGIEVIEEQLPLRKDGKPQPSDIPAAVDRLSQRKIDFLYHVGSTFTFQHLEAISDNATIYGIPMFSSAESAYRKGNILLGLVSPWAGIGQAAAYQAGQILFREKSAGSLSTLTVTRHTVLINVRIARMLRLYPPMRLLEFAEITD